MKFSFENLEVYQRSIAFNTEIDALIEQHKNKITRTLADQLARAALSVPLNIAEGNGRWHSADKRQYFWIARGSAFECVPIIEILAIKKVVSAKERESLRNQLEIISKMLTRLSQVHEKQVKKNISF